MYVFSFNLKVVLVEAFPSEWLEQSKTVLFVCLHVLMGKNSYILMLICYLFGHTTCFLAITPLFLH